MDDCGARIVMTDWAKVAQVTEYAYVLIGYGIGLLSGLIGLLLFGKGK
jgi:CRISPR/Cas system CSM-associated protein Csm5 (group 7 of RAMP superfamily)